MSEQTAADIRAAIALIGTPEKWCQGEDAIDAEGNSCEWNSARAVKRCVYSAIRYVTDGNDYDALCALERAAQMPPVRFNDTIGRTHEQVIAMMARAAQTEERNV